MKRVEQLIKENPETAFLAGFGLFRDIIGYAAVFFMIAAAGYIYNKKISETQEMVRATAAEVAVTLMQVDEVNEQVTSLMGKVDALADQADDVLDEAGGAVREVKKISPAGVKEFVNKSQHLNKKLKIVQAPVPLEAKDIPGLAIEGDLQLRQINEWRGRLRLPSVQKSKHLVIESMDRARDLAETCTLSHSGRNKKYGENLYLGVQGGAVDAWAMEREHYNARDGSCQPGKVCGHWTAIAWRDTKEIGCGTARCGDGRVVAVCSFWPAGNVVGQKAY
jgi:pathogenesis-related protein 1